jgi:integrase
MLNTGNRKSEHLALTWSENVFLDDALLKFLGKGRNEGKERIVPLNDVAIRLFRSAHRKLGEDRVFWQAKSKYTVDSAWQSAREKIGVPYKIHHFRSNRASHLVMAGIPVEKVMRIMGWEDYETYKIYAGLSDDFLKGDCNAVSFE